jgi:hypothetical protein
MVALITPAVRSLLRREAALGPYVDGYRVGDQGKQGTLYQGFTLGWAEDFLAPKLIGPSTPKERFGTTQIYGSGGRRGNTTILGTAGDVDPNYRGYNDNNRGVAYGFNNITVNKSIIQLQARKATTGTNSEQSMLPPTAAGINSGLRPNISAMLHTANSLIFTPGTNAVIWECLVRFSTGGPGGSHPDFWTSDWFPVKIANGSNWNVEGNSTSALFTLNRFASGVSTDTTYGSAITSIYDATTLHRLSIVLVNGGNCLCYVDGVLAASATGVSANPNVTPMYGLLTNHCYNATFNGEAYDASQWASSSNGFSIFCGDMRCWKTTGVPDYQPQQILSDVTIGHNDVGTITVPGVGTLFGDSTATQYVQALQFESHEAGNTDTSAVNRFSNGLSISGNTISYDFRGVQDNGGAIHIAVGAYKNGALCVPALLTLNRAPRVKTGNITATVNNPITPFDLYAQCDVGNNTPKTISVSGWAPGVTMDPTTYQVSGTPTDVSGSTTVTVTDCLGASRSQTVTYNNYQAETDALISRFATRPSKAKVDAFDACISTLKTAGLWSSTYQFDIYALDDAQAALVDWANGAYWQRPVGTPTFAAGAGFTSNGTSSGIDSGFNQVASGITGITNSISVSVWSLTSGQTANGGIGSYDGSTTGLTMNLRTTTDTFTARVNDNTADSVANTGGNGMFTATRRAASGAACKSLYKNGAKLADFTTASVSAHNSDLGVGVSLGNNSFSARQWAMLVVAAARSDANETTFYNAIRTLMTALGVP